MNRSPATLLLSSATLRSLATPADYFACARSAFMDLAAGRYEVPAVGHIPASAGAFHIKTASHHGERPLAVVKVNGNFPDNMTRHGLPTIQGFIALLDADGGSVLALIDSVEVTARRTAAATALAAHYLARQDSAVLGIIGCGVQAPHHLDALLDRFALQTVVYCDPRDSAAESFAAHARSLGLEALRVRDARDAAKGADIIVTLTPSRAPLLHSSDVAPGAFVAGVGADNPSKHELAADLLASSRVVVDLFDQASTMGDLHHALRIGALQPASIHGELADLVAGRTRGRIDDTQRYVFDSTGVATLDLAAAEMLYTRAGSIPNIPAIRLDDA